MLEQKWRKKGIWEKGVEERMEGRVNVGTGEGE